MASEESKRERILSAAVAEFGARGYAGARTAAIASRAEVNSQLITYYFGGKRGLLDELRKRWAVKQSGAGVNDEDFRATLAAWFEMTWSEPDWSRLVIWQALESESGEDALAQALSGFGQRLRAGAERMTARQKEGQVTRDVEPEFLVLLSYALGFAPIALPHIVSALYGDDPEAYRERWAGQLARLIGPREEGKEQR